MFRIFGPKPKKITTNSKTLPLHPTSHMSSELDGARPSIFRTPARASDAANFPTPGRTPKDVTASTIPEWLADVGNHGERLARSGVFEAFNPKQPISDAQMLAGRKSELKICIEKLLSRGGHVLLYGDRGVGKSSIAYVLCALFPQLSGKREYAQIEVRCYTQDTIKTIFAKPLRAAGVDPNILESASQNSEQKDWGIEGNLKIEAGVFIGKAEAETGSHYRQENTRTTSTKNIGNHELATNPAWIAEVLSERPFIMLIDEMDQIRDVSVKHQIATIIKHVSDNPRAKFKFVLAGIAQNAAELTAGHPSVQRCLAEIPISRLSRDHILEIFHKGAAKITIETDEGLRPLRFSNDVASDLAKKSHGYPYFAHLIGQGAALLAIERRDAFVDEQVELNGAVEYACTAADEDLRRSLDFALDKDERGRFRRLLIAAAEKDSVSFSYQEWTDAYTQRWGEELSAIAPYQQRLVADPEEIDDWGKERNGAKPILTRIKGGAYRFTDPRMASFIRLALSGAVNRFAEPAKS
jgi:Cdc6-like AAA superfamily ATPase